MARSKTAAPEIEYADLSALWPLLTQIAFVLLLGLVIARATTSYSLRPAEQLAPGASLAPRAAGAAAGVVLDLACAIPALLVLVRRVADKTYVLRGTLAHAFFAGFALLALVSTLWSADKFAALLQSLHLISAAACVWGATQLVRSWQRLRIVAGCCLGLLMTFAAQGLTYRFVDMPNTVKYFQANREKLLHERGFEPGTFAAEQFERKILAREMLGWLSSTNSFAAVVVFTTLAAGGLIVQRLKDKDETGLVGAIILAAAIGLPLIAWSQSKTALACLLIGVAALAVAEIVRPKLIAHRKAFFFAGVAGVVIAAMGVAILGLSTGKLPSDSLNFRWRYWVGASKLIAAHPITGVGYANFGGPYLAYRVPAATEEIGDPHNLPIRAFAELGIVGLVLALAWLGRSAWEMTRLVEPPTPKSSAKTTVATTAWTLGSIVAIALAVNIAASVDFFSPSNDAGTIVSELLYHGIYAACLLVGLAVACIRSTKEPTLDGRPARFALWGLLAAVGMLMLTNCVDFSFFEPGVMFLAALVIGSAIGVRVPSAAGKRKQTVTAVLVTTGSLAAWIVVAVVVAIPTIDAEAKSAAADELLTKSNPAAAARGYKDAFDAVRPRNFDYALSAVRASRWSQDAQSLVLARQMTAEAVDANPSSVTARLDQARLLLAAPPPVRDVEQGLSAFDKVIAMNPNDAPLHIEYGDALVANGRAAEAKPQYAEALRLDALLDKTEPERLSESQLIHAREGLK